MGFQFDFTCDMLKALINNNPESEQWYEELVEVLPKYDITTVERVAGFIAQCAHESQDFRALEENLNYSEDALKRVFSRYFGPGKRNAAEYARNPEKIANYVYQDEFRSKQGALGNTGEGDGWRFRGRGLKQLTGRNNYTAFAKSVNMTAEEAAEYLETKKGAVHSACWFWNLTKLNAIADAQDIVLMTKKINGGTIGLDDRKKRWEKALNVLGGGGLRPATKPALKKETPSINPTKVNRLSTLRTGSKGPEVIELQKALGVSADGVFGPGTANALKEWQRKNRLAADGIAGTKTLRKLYNL
jgi:putative chitinase